MEKIDISLIAIASSVITSIIAVYFTLRLLFREKKHSKSAIDISGVRNHLENKLYDYSEVLNSDPLRFANTNHLFIGCGKKHLGLNTHLKDNSFFYDLGINLQSLYVKKQMALCLMPFNKRFDKTYDIIKKSCKQCNFDCFRSDEPVTPGLILKQIVEMILEAQIIIALIDGRNPNVFYEIGIAHALGKNVILVSDYNDSQIPFDLRSNRFVLYHGEKELQQKLIKTLTELR